MASGLPEVQEEIESLQAIFDGEIQVTRQKIEYKSDNLHILFLLSEFYPNEPPSIKVFSHGVANEHLKETLESDAKEESTNGSPSLYNLISKAIELNTNFVQRNEKPVCEFFLKGACRFGDKCFNRHPGSKKSSYIDHTESANTEICDKSSQCLQEGESSKVPVKVSTKSTKNIESNTTSSKKVSMRTATDVIQRIMWDESFPTNHFVVGYLDRFKGIMEKNFTEFSWEDIATVDYNVLAIPKHRIQYFKYKETKIWDKNERMDKVFGSTGDKGELIHDIIASYPSDENEEELVDEVEKEVLVEKKESNNFYPDKNRPNHFICLRVADNQIVGNVKKLQKHILGYDDRLSEAMINTGCLHLTLFMMRLDSENDHKKANEVLNDLQVLFNWMLPINGDPIRFHGVSCFRDLVLYVNIRYHAPLLKFQEFAFARFKDAGIHLCGNYDIFTPHMTVMKFSRPLCKKLNFQGISPHYYSDFLTRDFGVQSVGALRLCLTGPERSRDDFYITRARILNSILSLSRTLPALIKQNVENLIKKGIFPYEQGVRLCASIDNVKETINVEKTILEVMNILSTLEHSENKYFFIMRGLPGSGKSYVTEKIMKNLPPSISCVSCSADKHFEKQENGYEFTGKGIHEAHVSCLKDVLKAIENKRDYIIIDNTNSTRWEYEIYERIALLCGYQSIIFQIPCESFEMSRLFQRRCKHHVKAAIHRRMFEKWEDDMNAVPLNIDEKQFTVHGMIQSAMKFRNDLQPSNVLYAAIFLDQTSKTRISNLFPSKLKHVHSDHVTLIYQPTVDDLMDLPIGDSVDIIVDKYYETSAIQVLSVKEVTTNFCKTKHPHITIATFESVKPQYSLELLENGKVSGSIPPQQCLLSGKIGLQVAYNPTSSWKCVDQVAIAKYLNIGTNRRTEFPVSTAFAGEENIVMGVVHSQLIDEESREEDDYLNDHKESSSIDHVSLHLLYDFDVIKQIYVFDFDGTLFHTPSANEGKEDFVKLTGRKWPHRGWLGQNESLLNPLPILPGPSLHDYNNHFGRPNSLTVLLTGRCEIVRKGVEAVLNQHQMVFDHIILKPQNKKERYSVESVYKYKKLEVSRLLSKYSDIDVLKVWDDRSENLTSIEELKVLDKKVSFQTFHVEETVPSFYQLSPMQLLKRMDMRRSPVATQATKHGIELIKSCWMQIMKLRFKCIEKLSDEKTDMFIQPFGSYLLGRGGDVDLCLLAPVKSNLSDLIERMGEKLIANGVLFCHVASNIRCPRIKIKLFFNECPPVEYDILVACVLPDSDSDILNLFKNHELDVNTLKKNCLDTKSKISLQGIIFSRNVFRAIESDLSIEDFSILTDFVCKILKNHRLKGNVFHCIRTFHVVELLSEFIQNDMPHSLKATGIESMKDYEKLLKNFFTYCAEKNFSDYVKLFKNFVPDQYIDSLKKFFTHAQSTSLEQQLFEGPDIKRVANMIYVTVSLSSNSKLSLWKGEIFLQSKLGSSIRNMIDEGVKIIPGWDNGGEVSFFTSDKSKSVYYLEELKSELYKDNVELLITFS